MATEINPGELHGKWVFSNEKGPEGTVVYRPDGHPLLQPSRGPDSFTLKADGSLQQTGIAPDDRHGLTATPGSWKLTDKNTLAFYSGAGGEKPQKKWTIVSVSPDKMVVKK